MAGFLGEDVLLWGQGRLGVGVGPGAQFLPRPRIFVIEVGQGVVLQRKLPKLARQGAELVDRGGAVRVGQGGRDELPNRRPADLVEPYNAKGFEEVENNWSAMRYVFGRGKAALAQTITLLGGGDEPAGNFGQIKADHDPPGGLGLAAVGDLPGLSGGEAVLGDAGIFCVKGPSNPFPIQLGGKIVGAAADADRGHYFLPPNA